MGTSNPHHAGLGRRAFIGASAAAIGGLALAGPLSGLAQARPRGPRQDNGYGPPVPAVDATTGLALLKLPRGFRYQSFGWTGDVMDDGTLTPDRHDGMAVVSVRKTGSGKPRGPGRGEARAGPHPQPRAGAVGAGQPPSGDRCRRCPCLRRLPGPWGGRGSRRRHDGIDVLQGSFHRVAGHARRDAHQLRGWTNPVGIVVDL